MFVSDPEEEEPSPGFEVITSEQGPRVSTA